MDKRKKQIQCDWRLDEQSINRDYYECLTCGDRLGIDKDSKILGILPVVCLKKDIKTFREQLFDIYDCIQLINLDPEQQLVVDTVVDNERVEYGVYTFENVLVINKKINFSNYEDFLIFSWSREKISVNYDGKYKKINSPFINLDSIESLMLDLLEEELKIYNPNYWY